MAGKKNHRSGGKYCGNHTTLNPFAAEVCDVVYHIEVVARISIGFLKTGLTSIGGNRRVKIAIQVAGVFLSIRDNIGHQEVHLYGQDPQRIAVEVARRLRNKSIAISFGKHCNTA